MNIINRSGYPTSYLENSILDLVDKCIDDETMGKESKLIFAFIHLSPFGGTKIYIDLLIWTKHLFNTDTLDIYKFALPANEYNSIVDNAILLDKDTIF